MKELTDNERIVKLPSREAFPLNLADKLTALLKTPDGTQKLHQIQAEALYELGRTNRFDPQMGMVGRIGLGAGKSLICFLAGSILKSVPGFVILIPGAHRAKTLRALQQARQHWKIRHDILIYSYEELSRRRDLLGNLVKKHGRLLVIPDEAHKLSSIDSGRTRQVIQEAVANPDIIWAPLSATLLKFSLKRTGHFYELALRNRSPLPLSDRTLQAWASVTDTDAGSEGREWVSFRPIYDKKGGTEADWQDPDRRLEACRKALARHFDDSWGVVTNQEASADCALNIYERDQGCPELIQQALTEMCKTNILPNSGGIAITHPWILEARATELSQGMFYYHDWTGTQLGKPDENWLGPRKAYAAEIRDFLAVDGAWRYHQLYTPGQIEQAFLADPGQFSDSFARAYRRWKDVESLYQIRTLYEPPVGPGEVIRVTPVWLTEEIVDRMVATMNDQPCILWYAHTAVALKLRDKGVDVYFPQSGGKARNPELAKGKRSIALSLKAHSDGFNLQQFHTQVFPCPPSDAMRTAQAIGRSLRYGQTADEINVQVWLHTQDLRDAWSRCLEHANTEHARGQKNSLATATFIQAFDTMP